MQIAKAPTTNVFTEKFKFVPYDDTQPLPKHCGQAIHPEKEA